MKLHLPSMLRKAVLSCMAVVASLSTTVATGVVSGGVVAWAIAHPAWAGTPTDSATAQADDLLWFYTEGQATSNLPATATITNNFTANDDGTAKTVAGSAGLKINDIDSASTSGFSVSFVLSEITRLDNWQNVLSLGTLVNGAQQAAEFQADNQERLMIYAANFGGGSAKGVYTLGAYADLVGKTITLTFDGKSLSAYVDGRLAQVLRYTFAGGATPSAGLSDIAFGANLEGNGRWACELSYGDIGIWDSAMSMAEVIAYAGAADTGIYSTTLSAGVTDATAAQWYNAGNAVSYGAIPLTGENTVLSVSAGTDGAILQVSENTTWPELWIAGGEVTLQSAADTSLAVDSLKVASGSKLVVDAEMTVSQFALAGELSIAKDGVVHTSTTTLNHVLEGLLGKGTLDLTETSTINGGVASSFSGVIGVAGNKILYMGSGDSEQGLAVTLADATIQLGNGSELNVTGYQSQLAGLDAQGNASVKIDDTSLKDDYALKVGQVKIAKDKTLTAKSHWEGLLCFGNLNAEGHFVNEMTDVSPVTIQAIEKSANIINKQSTSQLTLGVAGERSILNIGGTISNAGTLILADADVTLNISNIADFKGTIDYDRSAVWNYISNATSTTGNGFAIRAGNMHVLSNTGTVKIGADGVALVDLSGLKATYGGVEVSLTADGKYYVASDEVLTEYIIGGTGENATVALSTINAEATAGGVEWKKIILRDATTLEVDENATLSVDKLECAATAKINVNNGVTVTAGGEGSGTYSANYIANMAGTGTLLVNHDTQMGAVAVGEINSEFAGTVSVTDGAWLYLGHKGGPNNDYKVRLSNATIALDGGSLYYYGNVGGWKMLDVIQSGDFDVHEVRAEGLDIETIRVAEGQKLSFGPSETCSFAGWQVALNIDKLIGTGDLGVAAGYYAMRTLNIESVGTQEKAFGDFVYEKPTYQNAAYLTINLGVNGSSVLNMGDIDLPCGSLNIKGQLLGDSHITAPTITLADDVTVKGDVTLASTFTQETGKTLTVDGGALTIAVATTVDTLSVENDGVVSAHAAITINNLTLSSGGALGFDLSKLAAGATPITASTYGDALNLKLGGLIVGEYTLFQGASTLTLDKVMLLDALTGQQLSNTGRATVQASVEDGTGLVKVTVSLSGNLDDLVWETADTDNVWASGGGTNWTSAGAGADQQFYNGDTVAFNDAGEVISIAGTVTPAAITISGTGYVFEGTGSIGGAGALTVAAGAEATISTVNTFTGGTTIAEGATLTITKAKALSTFNNMDNETVLGKVSGAGTLVINLDSAASEAVAKGADENANMGGFTGIVDVQRGTFFVGERNNENGAGAETVFAAQKVILREEGRMWLHTDGDVWELGAAVDAMSGAELNNRTGKNKLNGKVRFNVSDLENGSYDADGCVTVRQNWGGEMDFAGLLEGDGTVQLLAPLHSRGTYKITGDNNSFAGTYKVVDSRDADAKDVNLRLGAQNAAQYADINLATTTSKSYLLLDSDATINGLYGVVDAENAVQAQGGNRTLTVTEGDIGALIMDSGSNVLSLTKQGAVDTTLILRGANSYTGATTINGGTLELAAGAELASELVTVAGGAVLAVNEGIYASTYVDGTGTIEKRGEAAGDYVDLAGLADTFAGTIDVQGGNLRLGDTLEIKTGRTLKAGANGAYLNNALTLSGGKLALDYTTAADAEITMLNLSENALTLLTGNTLSLSGLVLADTTTQANTIDLLTGVGSLLGSDGNALELTDALASTYFSSIEGLGDGIDTTTLGLQLADGKLQLVVPVQTNYLVWDENKANDTWAAGTQFGDEAQDTFTGGADVKFGALTAESETVTISGDVAAGKVLIDGGEGKTYIFAVNDASGIASAESITVNSGTACFGEGTLDMTADTTLAVNDGATLLLNNGAIAAPDAVDIVLNDGSTLEWNADNTTDYSTSMDVADGAKITLVNGNGTSKNVKLTAGSINAAGETATVTLKGGYFQLDSETVYGDIVIANDARMELMSSNTPFAQDISGEGGIFVNFGQGPRHLSGNNTYSGETKLDAKLILDGAQALSENSKINSWSGELYLSKLAGAETEEYTINRVFTTDESSTLSLYVGLNATDVSSVGAVSGVTLNLGSQSNIKSSDNTICTVNVRGGNTVKVADGATLTGKYNLEQTATLVAQGAIANAIEGAGMVKIDGDFTWNNTNKTYTGETQVLAGSTLTAAAPLTSGATKGKVQLLEDGAMIITSSTNWANKVYGAGTLVLVNQVTNLNAIVDGAATDTLARMEIGKAVATRLTQDVNGRVDINTTDDAAAMAKVDTVVVNAGSVLTNKVTGTEAAPVYLGQNLVLSGAGDAGQANWLQAALSLHGASTGVKYLASNVSLAADATIYVDNYDAWLSGDFNTADHKLTKTGAYKLGLNGSSIDLSGGVDIQNGSLEVNHTATTALAVGDVNLASGKSMILNGKSALNGAVTMADSSKLQFKGQSELNGGLDVGSGSVQLIVNIVGDSSVVSEVDIASAVTGAQNAAITLNHTAPSNPAEGSGVLTLSVANEYAGTWNVNTSAWELQLAHANAAQYATLNYTASAALKLMDGTGLETYNVKALKSSVTEASIATEGTARHTLNITNALTAVADATYQGSVAGTVDVVLAGGAQKLSGALGDGSTYKVSAGTLALSGANQSGTHSFTAAGGVLDMTGYARAAVATTADGDEGTATPMPTVYDTIYAVGGQVVGLNLGAGMLLTDVLPAATIDTSAAATLSKVALGGASSIGAGSLAFRVKDSTNLNTGNNNTPYRLTNTQYAVGSESGDTLTLAAIAGRDKTYLQISLLANQDVLDPTPASQGGNYRDHVLISGMSVEDTIALDNGKADASNHFAMNLQNVGSTKYDLLFVQNADNNALYDLVLRASGMADTLFWGNVAGGDWNLDTGANDWVMGAKDAQGAWQPTTEQADFEQYDYVYFGDLTDAGGAVESVVVNAGSWQETDAGGNPVTKYVEIGTMVVNANDTDYTINGTISSAAGNEGATLTKTGTGTLTLTGANSYAGNTTISGGTVIAQNDAALSNTMVDLKAGTLVLDFQNAGTDGELDALLLMKGGNTLVAKTDATVRYATSGAAKTFTVSSGKTLTLKPTNTDGTAGSAVAGTLQVNTADAAEDGTVKLELLANTAYTSSNTISNNIIVGRGELVFAGAAATTTWSGTIKVSLAEDTTLRVQGGMTLSVGELAAWKDGDGTISLEDASKLTLTTGGAKTINTAIESEGATLSATGTDAVLTVKDLTLKGTETNAAADTTLSGGTWVLEQGAVVWDAAATGALAVAANTTVKVNDDTMKKLKVIGQAGQYAKLATAKADGSAAALSVETITVSNYGTVEGVDLTLTGTGSSIKSETNGTTGTADDVVVDLDDSITMDDTTPVALEIGGGVVLDSLTILRGEVMTVGTAWNRKIGGDAIVLNGSEAVLNLNGLDKTKNAAGQAPTILIHAGSLKGADAFTGQVIIDDQGVAQTIAVGGLRAAKADVLLRDIETANGVTTLTGFNGVKLADGSAFDLTSKLAEGEGNLLFSITNVDGDVKAATGATVSIGVNDVLGDVLDAGSVSYTIADKSIAPLASAVAWDATLALYNISATFGTDGKLTLAATDVPLSDDDIYRSSEDNIDDGTQWAGNGPTVYTGKSYASVYIDSATEIDLTHAAAGAGDGLVLSNLIGRGNGANLTIVGDGNDKVTINNNLDVADLGSSVNMLSFNGDIDVTDTTLQLLNTVATPGADNAGELDTESVYQMNGALKTDAASLVELSAGILKLNGKGAKSSELLGGVLVANGKGMLQVSGDASVGGNLDISISDSDVEDAVPDAEIVSGGKLTLLDRAAIRTGFDIAGQGQGKETLSIAEDAAVMLESYSSVMDTVLELQKGSELTWVGTQAPDSAIVSLDGLTGSGAIVNMVDQGGQDNAEIVIVPQGNSTFSGDLRRYEGYVSILQSEGTQTLDKVSTADAGASKLDLYSNGNLNINVAEESGNKTLNVREFVLAKDSVTTIEMNTDSGAPALTIGGVATIADEAKVTLSSNSAEVLAAGDRLLLAQEVGTGGVGNLNGVSITLDTTDDAFRRLSETATLSVVGKDVLVNLVASETNRYADAVSDPNALAGAELLWPVNPGELDKDSALKAVDQAVADMLKTGNKSEAERVLAAVAGSSTAVLGSAFSADVERQLRAIRNRTTTMGVGQCEVNEGMPYVNAWINAEGDHRELDSDGLAAGYTLDSWGGTVGFDMDLTTNLTMGMALTAMYGDIDADGPDKAEGDFDTQYVSLFARVAHQAWVHTFVATVGRADASLNRTVSYGNGAYETTGDTDGMGYGFMYEVARTYSLSEDGSTCWQPMFNVAWRHSSLDSYTEKGGDAALEVGEQEMNVLTFGLGARLQSVVGENIYNRASVFEARALVKFDAGDREGEADVALIGGANASTVTAAEVGAVGVEIGAGLTIPMGMESGSIFIDGSAELRSGYTNINGTVGYRINF